MDEVNAALEASGGPYFLGADFSLVDCVFAPFLERIGALNARPPCIIVCQDADDVLIPMLERVCVALQQLTLKWDPATDCGNSCSRDMHTWYAQEVL